MIINSKIVNRKRFSLKKVILKKVWACVIQACITQSCITQVFFVKQASIKHAFIKHILTKQAVIPLMQMRRFLLLLISTTFFVTACSTTTEETVANNDLLTAKALYFDKRTPDDFYHEESSSELFASISHVKNIGILPLDNRSGLSVYELSSDDFVEAMTWDEQATVYQPLYSQLVANSETDLYYQFTRVNPDLPEFVDISRVFKAGTLNRAGVDRSDEDGEYQGKIMLTDMTAADVKQVVEYLWMFSFSNNYSNAVLESYTNETVDEFIHTLKQAKINFSYDGSCDEIELYEIRYSIAKESGLIWRDKVLMNTFSAKRDGISVEICK
jgi:hypothetical protein